jgi:hypothetical protein
MRQLVMPGLVPGIHVLTHSGKKDVDGRDKPGHDEAPNARAHFPVYRKIYSPWFLSVM